jgi:hypothetical protein
MEIPKRKLQSVIHDASIRFSGISIYPGLHFGFQMLKCLLQISNKVRYILDPYGYSD